MGSTTERQEGSNGHSKTQIWKAIFIASLFFLIIKVGFGGFFRGHTLTFTWLWAAKL